jgi:molybdate transport system ATP-binding protein
VKEAEDAGKRSARETGDRIGLSATFLKRFAGGPEIRVDDLTCANAERVTVLFGASGAGKTTVLRCIAGLDKPDEGKIVFDEEVWFDSMRARMVPTRNRRIGFVPQDFALFPHLSIERNVSYGLSHLSEAEKRKQVAEAIDWLGLTGLERRLPQELSGGEQQRAALARAVVTRPRLLLLDEPLSSLDTPTRQRLRVDLGRLLKHMAIPSLLVTHDRTEAVALGEDLIVIVAGRIVQRGAVREVFSRPVDLAVAGIVAVETIQPGRVLQSQEGLVTVGIEQQKLLALAPDLPPATVEVSVCIRAEDVILMRGEPVRSSPRNCLPARVRTLEPEGAMVRIGLDCGFALAALLTKQACDELALAPGEPVLALIKAPQIHLIPHS